MQYSIQAPSTERMTRKKLSAAILILHYFCFRSKSYLFVNMKPQRRPNTFTLDEKK